MKSIFLTRLFVFKKNGAAILLLFLLMGVCFRLQAQVTVTVIIKPPYSSYLSEYGDLSNKVIITLKNNFARALNITLHGQLKMSGSEYLYTDPVYRPASPLALGPNELKVITVDHQQLSFLKKTALISLLDPAVWQQVQATGILPEAYWQLCVTAVDYNDGSIMGTGCVYFSINRANAPVITSPFNNQNIPAKQPNVVFSWTPPIGNLTGAQLLYDLYAVKVMPDQNPNDAINAAVAYKANNPLIKTNLPANQYVTQPYDLKLDTGFTYAVQVVARDLNKQIAFQNDGRSEVITFKYGSFSAGQPVVALVGPIVKKNEKKSTANSFPVTNVDPVPMSIIKGKLYYKFKEIATISIPNTKPKQGMNVALLQEDALSYNKDNIPATNASPLSNVKVSLVVTYLLSGSANSIKYDEDPIDENSFNEKHDKYFKDNEKVLATTTTNTDGSFSFQFVNTQKDLGLTDPNFKITATKEVSDKASGKLYKVIRLRVENKYYCSPDVNIKLSPWEGIDLGTVVSYVKSYNLAVKVISTTASFHDIQDGKGTSIEKVKTSLSRYTTPAFVPGNEAGNKSQQKSQGKKIVAEKQTNGNGVATFFNLVQHDPDNQLDRYYVKCETSKTEGAKNFKTHQSAYYPLWDKDKKNFPFNSPGQYMQSSKGSGLNLPVDFGEDITWNRQLEIKTYNDTMMLEPERPRVFGRVYPLDKPDAKPMSDVVVMMLNNYVKNVPIYKMFLPAKTNSQGLYQFENLDMETGSLSIIKDTADKVAEMSLPVIGPNRQIYASPSGFKSEKQPVGILKWGAQQEHNIPVTPDGTLAGYVEDENGNAVEAKVIVDNLASIYTKPQLIYAGGNDGNKSNGPGNDILTISGIRQAFNLPAPSGTGRDLVIDPVDSKYYSIESKINIPQSDGKTPVLIKFVVQKAKKRIRFRVLGKSSPSKIVAPGSAKPVAGAKVKLNITGTHVEQVSGTDGYVTFIFENMASSFSFSIMAPQNAELEESTYQLNNVPDSKNTQTYPPAYLNPAATITGTVTLGPSKTLLAGASVYIDLGNGNKLETKTGTDGKYILKSVGMQTKKKTVWASKPGAVPNIISQSQIIELKATNTLDFNLQADNDIVIENIYGFTVDIQSKEKRPDGTFEISGKLVNLQGNNNFKLKTPSQSIPFDSLIIKKSGTAKNGIPVGVPANNSFVTDLAGMDLIVQDAFEAVQFPHENDRLAVVNENGTGKVVGRISIRKSSFGFTQNYLSFKNTGDAVLSLTDQPGSANNKLPGIIAGTMALQKYGISAVNGSELNYTYIGFDSKADKNKSFLQGKDLCLYTILNTGNIPGMVPAKLQIDIGALMIHPNAIDAITGNKPLSFKLEDWDFTAPKWTIQQTVGGIGIAAATIKTGVVDVPVTNVLIKPNDIDIGEFELNNISFSGVVPLKIGIAKPVFGYNPVVGSDNKPHWELRIAGQDGGPGAIIQSLPGMKTGDEIKFQEFSLISNGEQKITQGNQQQTLRFYNVMDVTPVAFSGGNGYFIMQTMTDLNIPQLAATSANLKFTKSAGQVKLEVLPINVSLTGPGDVEFIANLQYNDKPLSVSNGKFTAKGTIMDNEGIVLKGTLNRTVNDAWVEVDPKNQKLPLGSGQTSLANIDGKMQADMNAFAWQKFSFSGDMVGFKGMQGNTRKTFIVNGSITADDEKIDVKNIPTAFGGLNITYDIKHARFTGNLQLNKQIGTMQITGTADLLVDGGGWYFLAGGNVQTPGLGALSAGLLIGDYNSMPQNVAADLMQFAYDKNVPPGFKNGISGFFFTGMKELPIVNIPNTSIDLGVISASFGVHTGLDARLWMGFNDSGNEYGIGAMAFAHAFLEGASITCTKFSAEAKAELGIKGVYTSSNGAFSLKGCGSFTIGGSISQCVPTPCWDGICCKFCGGIGVSKGIRVDLLLDSNGNTDLSFGFGNCSGQNNMTGNW